MLSQYNNKYSRAVIPEELNKININGLTPALLAAFVGNLEGIRILCAAGADPTIKNAIDGDDITGVLIRKYLKLLPELEEILQDYRDGKYRSPTPIPVPPPPANPPTLKAKQEETLLTSFYSSFSKVKAFFTACSEPTQADESQQELLTDPQTIATVKKMQ